MMLGACGLFNRHAAILKEMTLPQEQHQREINENLAYWQTKPILQAIYRAFYGEIARHVRRDLAGAVVELGSGLSNLKTVLPDCVCTDIFPHPWLDQVENAYTLSFGAGTVSNLILFDVFHHLAYPGTALQEFQRVLTPQGRVLVFEPAVSLLGWWSMVCCIMSRWAYFSPSPGLRRRSLRRPRRRIMPRKGMPAASLALRSIARCSRIGRSSRSSGSRPFLTSLPAAIANRSCILMRFCQ